MQTSAVRTASLIDTNFCPRRTLVEDTVGKILLQCWHGVKSEIVQVLREVFNQYINDEPVGPEQKYRVRQLSHIGGAFRQAIDHIPDGGLNPLRRIMDDAEHRVSKHQLLLTERAELASQDNEARHTLKRKRETSVSAEPPSPVKVKR
ncbi:hypothetical protein EDC04DRAFT_430807 [Pisolithus marmoratus]|nr:hypothetical protein EDC04DRAFT_430807 [Pisolithus marmoratus]